MFSKPEGSQQGWSGNHSGGSPTPAHPILLIAFCF